MNRPILALLLLAATSAIAQDVYVPPVPIGIKGEGKVRPPKHIPFPAEDEVWLRLRSLRFDIISSASEEKTRAIANDLETLANALNRETLGAPATIFVFAKRRESQPYFELLIGQEKTTIAGVYVRHEGGGTMFIDAGYSRVDRTVLHELIHDILRRSDVTPPLWIEEGLAEYYSNARVEGDTVIAGDRIPEHVSLIRKYGPWTPEAIFAVTTGEKAAMATGFYAQAWAAVQWLMELGPSLIDPFARDLTAGLPVADALQKHYGKSLEDLSKAIRNPGKGKLELKKGTVSEFNITQLDRATLLFELGHFLSHVGGAGEESLRHYRGAIAANPKHARTLAALGEFEAAIAADPDNAEVHLTYAESLMRDAIGPFASFFEAKPEDVTTFRKARTHAERALALGAEEGRTRGTIGATYIVETDTSPAIPYLERARQLAPLRMDFALHLYDFYLRHGERAKAHALFASTFERARDKQTIFAARNLLLRYETDRANALAKQGKLDEAAAVLRELAAATSDVMARQELEKHAAQMAATAIVNRHIEMYNQAVAAANTGRRKEAIKILDELLRLATDAQVVRDAQRLRGQVASR